MSRNRRSLAIVHTWAPRSPPAESRISILQQRTGPVAASLFPFGCPRSKGGFSALELRRGLRRRTCRRLPEASHATHKRTSSRIQLKLRRWRRSPQHRAVLFLRGGKAAFSVRALSRRDPSRSVRFSGVSEPEPDRLIGSARIRRVLLGWT